MLKAANTNNVLLSLHIVNGVWLIWTLSCSKVFSTQKYYFHCLNDGVVLSNVSV
jgi:hypothetical protein